MPHRHIPIGWAFAEGWERILSSEVLSSKEQSLALTIAFCPKIGVGDHQRRLRPSIFFVREINREDAEVIDVLSTQGVRV